jgi:hypothetical protein
MWGRRFRLPASNWAGSLDAETQRRGEKRGKEHRNSTSQQFGGFHKTVGRGLETLVISCSLSPDFLGVSGTPGQAWLIL